MSTAWSGTDPAESADSGHYELGIRWQALRKLTVTGIRVWAGPAGDGTITARQGRIWSSTAAVLAAATLPDTLPAGWSEWELGTPVTFNIGDQFVTSYTNGGFYGELNNVMGSAHVSADGAVQTVPSASAPNGNGSFTTGVTAFPDVASSQDTFYGVDLVYVLVAVDAPVITSLAVGSTEATATASVTADNATGAAYTYDWGDGSTDHLTVATASHTYAASGLYAVLVTVTNDAGSDADAQPLAVTITASTSYEAAKPTTGLDLATVPQAILAAVVTYFEQNAVDLPARRYVTAGDPSLVAWDCEQLVVCLADLGWGRATDATQLSPSFGKAASVNAMRHATYSILLTRPVPIVQDGPELPAATDLNTVGLAVMADAGLLSQALVNFVAFRNTAVPHGVNVQAGAVQMIGPSGGLVGCAGALIVTAAQLTDPPTDAIPHGLAIRNGSPGGGL